MSRDAENDPLREAVERLAARYENTSRDTWSRPDVVAANLRRLLDETRPRSSVAGRWRERGSAHE